MRKIILFELNEVPWKIMHYFVKQRPQSNLARLLPKCSKYETVTPDAGHLSPWITWPTFHRGVDNTRHKISDFNQDLSQTNRDYPPVWTILHQHGVKTGVFGSMHSSPVPGDYADYAFYIPDAFAVDSKAHPKYIEPFQDFNLSMSRVSARNVSSGIDTKSGMRMALRIPQLGFKMNTFMKLGKQLMDERKRPWVKTRRRTYQVVLAFDVFMKQLNKAQPQFSTFFSNHVASSMHRYWAATFPEDYSEFHIEKEWVETYRNEILFTMTMFDQFFTELVKFVDAHPEYKLVVASSMGQASTTAKLLESQLYIANEETFFSFLKMNAADWKHVPSMFPQYNVHITEGREEQFRQLLDKISICGEKLEYREKEKGFFSLELGHPNLQNDTFSFDGQTFKLSEIGLEKLPIDDHSGSTAYHIPQGTMIVYDPADLSDKKEITSIPSTAFVPGVMKNFNLDIPSYMHYQKISAIA